MSQLKALIAILLGLAFQQNLVETRNFIHTPEEVALTDLPPIIPRTDCFPGHKLILVHSAAQSTGKYRERREIIRKTWGLNARKSEEFPLHLYFVIGRSNSTSEQVKLKKEAFDHQDILQFDFIDNYYNMTLKAIAELKWAMKHCNSSGDYIARVDDDTYVNVPNFFHLKTEGKSGFIGHLDVTYSDWYREVGNKWEMPPKYYPAASYKFLKGFGYILTLDRLPDLIQAISTYPDPILDIDDMFITGILADYANITRHNSPQFIKYCEEGWEPIRKSLVSWGCDTAGMKNRFGDWCKVLEEIQEIEESKYFLQLTWEECIPLFGVILLLILLLMIALTVVIRDRRQPFKTAI